jgi:putative ABC transport system permease protein
MPLAGLRGPVGMLARHGARAAVRRTAATAAPILVTVGIAGSTLGGFGTLTATIQQASQHRVLAPAMVTPSTGEGLADPTVAAVRAVPGVTAAVPVTDTKVYVRQDGSPEDWTGRYVNGPDLAGVLDLPVVAGNLADLTGTGTIAVPVGRWHLGDLASLWLGDSTPVRLRVVAVLADQIDLAQTVLLPWALRDGHTAKPLATELYLRLAPGSSPATVTAGVSAAGGRLIPTGDYLSAADAEQARTNRLAMIAVLGMALIYTGIAIANTLVMATGDRSRELATLRLSGATPAQVLRVIGLEAVLVTGIGVLFAGAVTAVTVLGMRQGLAGVAPAVSLAIPWLPVGAIALTCLVIAILASLIPAAVLLRRHPVELAGVRE